MEVHMSENEMKILKHRVDSEEWNTITSSEYDQEENLQQIIADNPELIPVSEIIDNRSEIKVAVREFPIPGSGPSGSTGSCDIVGLDEEGNIYVIEAKLESNAEVKREVLAQTFDYASSLYDSDYENFIDNIEKEWHGEDLEEYMRGITDSDNGDFFASVKNNLTEGQFTLLIVVDEVNTNLEKILEFMNMKLDGIEVYAVAFRRFTEGQESDEFEYLVPRIFGTSAIESSKSKDNEVDWSYEKLKQEYRKRGFERNLELLEWAKENNVLGTGVMKKPRFRIINRNGKEEKQVIKVTENEKVNCFHGAMKLDRYPSKEVRDEFVDALNQLPIFDLTEDYEGSHQSSGKLTELNDRQFAFFKNVLENHCTPN